LPTGFLIIDQSINGSFREKVSKFFKHALSAAKFEKKVMNKSDPHG
jgi:hypothetical protein